MQPMEDPAPASPPLARLLAGCAEAVQAVRAGRSLNDSLARVDPRLRPGVQALTFQVMRRLGAATEARRLLAPRQPAPSVDALLCSALALLWPDGAPPYPVHTLVDQAVAAARQRTPAAAGFVNAVLRRFGRERDAFVAAALRNPEARFNHPRWWIERLQADWPAQWEALLAAGDEHPPMTLRVNRRRTRGADYLPRLEAAGLGGRLLDVPGTQGQTVVLDRPCPVEVLPGFADGDVSVQDAAAQRAAPLLIGDGLPAGARVLDACAAPGGKTAHLLELAELDLLALDRDAGRLQRVAETLRRLRLHAELRAADATRPSDWWDGRPFDAILLDAPCSASGIVRRHPDIRWLRRPADLETLAATQAQLLDALWPLLKPGGRLLCATCSIFRCEGEHQIDAFLQRSTGAGARRLPASPGTLLPLPDNADETGPALNDGFHLALLLKNRPP
jgi:16S rRNA (cytosine967-C5)-methyltransferase